MKLNLPTTWTVVLSAAAGVLVAFNQASFGFATEWKVGITVGLTALAAWGISPLTGSAFKALLHLPNAASVAIAGVLGALQVVFLTVSVSSLAHGLIAGVLTFAAGLGFAPTVTAAAKKKATARRRTTSAALQSTERVARARRGR